MSETTNNDPLDASDRAFVEHCRKHGGSHEQLLVNVIVRLEGRVRSLQACLAAEGKAPDPARESLLAACRAVLDDCLGTADAESLAVRAITLVAVRDAVAGAGGKGSETADAPVAGKCQHARFAWTIAEHAEAVLRELGFPMSATEIAARAIENGYDETAGDVSLARSRFAATISKDLRSGSSRFKQFGRARIGLAAWADTASAGGKEGTE